MIRLAVRGARQRFGGVEAREFGPKALRDCQAALVEEGLSRTETNRWVRLIRGFFGWLVTEELIPAETWHALKAVPRFRQGRAKAPERRPVGRSMTRSSRRSCHTSRRRSPP